MNETPSFAILGPLEVLRNGQKVPIAATKERALLALLLIRREDVPSEVLIDALWGGQPPSSARNTLQVYISKLRRILGRDCIETTASGYRLHLKEDASDAIRFERFFHEARRAAADPERARELLAEALALWRGPALSDLRYEGFAQVDGSMSSASHASKNASRRISSWAGTSRLSASWRRWSSSTRCGNGFARS